MTASTVLTDALIPALALLPARMDTPLARVIALAIMGQESNFTARRQVVKRAGVLRADGPATGLGQFEEGGGVRGVLTHPSSAGLAAELCRVRDVRPNSRAVWERLQFDDVLAAGFTRLLLWTDPQALPALGDVTGAWALYLRVWRPGKPHREKWDGYYQQARAAVGV